MRIIRMGKVVVEYLFSLIVSRNIYISCRNRLGMLYRDLFWLILSHLSSRGSSIISRLLRILSRRWGKSLWEIRRKIKRFLSIFCRNSIMIMIKIRMNLIVKMRFWRLRWMFLIGILCGVRMGFLIKIKKGSCRTIRLGRLGVGRMLRVKFLFL